MIAVFNKVLNSSSVRLAIILAGMVVLLGLSGSSVIHSLDFFHVGFYIEIQAMLLTAILLGFVLGWLFPKVKKFCPDLLVLFMAALFFWGYFLFFVVTHKPIPQDLKLADCSGKIVSFHLTAPRGHDYDLLLKGISSYQFTGNLQITSGESLITNAPLNSNKMLGEAPTERFFGLINLKGGKDYDIQIEFNPPCPPGSSIWLYWMQSAADRGG